MAVERAEPGDGVLVISVWRDDTGFRARLIYGKDEVEDPASVVAATPEDVVSAVANWLDRIAR